MKQMSKLLTVHYQVITPTPHIKIKFYASSLTRLITHHHSSSRSSISSSLSIFSQYFPMSCTNNAPPFQLTSYRTPSTVVSDAVYQVIRGCFYGGVWGMVRKKRCRLTKLFQHSLLSASCPISLFLISFVFYFLYRSRPSMPLDL